MDFTCNKGLQGQERNRRKRKTGRQANCSTRSHHGPGQSKLSSSNGNAGPNGNAGRMMVLLGMDIFNAHGRGPRHSANHRICIFTNNHPLFHTIDVFKSNKPHSFPSFYIKATIATQTGNRPMPDDSQQTSKRHLPLPSCLFGRLIVVLIFGSKGSDTLLHSSPKPSPTSSIFSGSSMWGQPMPLQPPHRLPANCHIPPSTHVSTRTLSKLALTPVIPAP